MLFTHLSSSALGSTDTLGPLKLQRASCEPNPGGPCSIEPKDAQGLCEGIPQGLVTPEWPIKKMPGRGVVSITLMVIGTVPSFETIEQMRPG